MNVQYLCSNKQKYVLYPNPNLKTWMLREVLRDNWLTFSMMSMMLVELICWRHNPYNIVIFKRTLRKMYMYNYTNMLLLYYFSVTWQKLLCIIKCYRQSSGDLFSSKRLISLLNENRLLHQCIQYVYIYIYIKHRST